MQKVSGEEQLSTRYVEKCQGEMDEANELGYHGMQKTRKGFQSFHRIRLVIAMAEGKATLKL